MFRFSRIPPSLYVALPVVILIVSMGGGATPQPATPIT